MNDLHEVQKAMIRFVEVLGDIYPHELKAAFEDFTRELKQYENDPYERRSFCILIFFLGWRVKLKRIRLQKSFKNKATQLNRKERPSISHVSAGAE